jgi:hypothetical protein
MIKEITTKDPLGQYHNFTVTEETFEVNKIGGIEYKIYEVGSNGLKYFLFRILIQDTRIIVYMIDNNDHPELSQKGIVRAMIDEISKSFKRNIVSSTNFEDAKVDETEGRIPLVTQYWNKWMKSDPRRITIDRLEKRFIYNYLSNE